MFFKKLHIVSCFCLLCSLMGVRSSCEIEHPKQNIPQKNIFGLLIHFVLKSPFRSQSYFERVLCERYNDKSIEHFSFYAS